MAKNWDYAELTRTAKEFGGPGKYLQMVKDHSFQEGRKEQLVMDGAIALVAGGLYLGVKTYKRIKNKITMNKVTKEQAKEAEEILVKNMNEVLEEETKATQNPEI